MQGAPGRGLSHISSPGLCHAGRVAMSKFRDFFSDVRAAKITFGLCVYACIIVLVIHLMLR